jgi:uncharacterized ion transporter superfamily protein YfcC
MVIGTYHNMNFFDIFIDPVLVMIDLADISFTLMILGGNIIILVEMKAITNGLKSLAKELKGRNFILLCIIELLVSIGGTTFRMTEECFPFYPILMPIFLKNGLDGMLSAWNYVFNSQCFCCSYCLIFCRNNFF